MGEGRPLRLARDGRKLVEIFLGDERTFVDLHRGGCLGIERPQRVCLMLASNSNRRGLIT